MGIFDMKSLESYLKIENEHIEHFEDVYSRYKQLYDNPDECKPMLIVRTPVATPTYEEKLADPIVMLKSELDAIRPHLEIKDDRVPTVRVQFGTAQIAAAFGCDIVVPENNLPAAKNHVLKNLEDVYDMEIPSVDSGWYSKLKEWTLLWRSLLPEGVHIQHPDIQSAFNSSHLIRGNDILTDFYDNPEAVRKLMSLVTDFMITVTKDLKGDISDDNQWFFDWNSMWKGFARISNCSSQMISPEMYFEHVLPEDVRFFDEVGGGRMHYCGINKDVISEFFKVPSITGLDFDHKYHDFYAICEEAPEKVVLTPTVCLVKGSPELDRMLSGDWPKKRNIIISVLADDVTEGKKLLKSLKKAMPY